jgi:hypothetical protein
MIKHRHYPILILTFCLITALASMSGAGESPLDRLFPLPELTGEWVLEEPVKTYTPDDLFTYINGEAELYFPFGFDKLASAFYSKKGADPTIGLAVDVYAMGSLLDAFGIYAQYRKPESEVLPLGGEGFVNPSQLMFYQDRYFIHLSASGTAQMDRAVFETFGRALSRRLPGPSVKPKELDWLKIPSLMARTERYYPEGLLGYRFFQKGLIALAGLEEKKVRVFVMKENSPESAEKVVIQYIQYLKESGVTAQKKDTPYGPAILAADPLHKGLVLARKGPFLVGVADLNDPSQGLALVNELQNGLSPSAN